MKSILLLIGENLLKHYNKWDILTFIAFTFLSLLIGQVTFFYLIYFFWWNEVILSVVDRFYSRRNPNAVFKRSDDLPWVARFFMMLVYLIIAFFVFVIFEGWHNQDHELMGKNAITLYLLNPFFTLNLIFILIQRIRLHKKKQPVDMYFGITTPNKIILHVSLLVGLFLLIFVVNKYPTLFTSKNHWGSALIALPFLLMKLGMYYKLERENKMGETR